MGAGKCCLCWLPPMGGEVLVSTYAAARDRSDNPASPPTVSVVMMERWNDPCEAVASVRVLSG